MFTSDMLNCLFYSVDWKAPSLIANGIINKHYRHIENYAQTSAKTMLKTLSADKQFSLFVDSMNKLHESALYESYVHGKSHIERVAIMSFVLGLRLKLNHDDLILCLEIAKYHDVGRQNEGEDEQHGLRGAERIATICGNFSEHDQAVIAAVVAAHSLRDECNMDIFQNWDRLRKSQYPRCKLLLDIIKDADALDRFRLRDNSLNTCFFRLPDTQQLVRAACETVHAFDSFHH